MKKKYEIEFMTMWCVIFAVLILIFSYLNFGVLERFYCIIISFGLLGLYYYNKDKKEEEDNFSHLEPQSPTLC